MGVKMGCFSTQKKARVKGVEMQRKKPIILTKKTHENLLVLAIESNSLLTQGHTVNYIQEALRKSLEENATLHLSRTF